MRKELEYRHPKVGTFEYIEILMLFTEYPEVQVKAAVELCVRCRAFSKDAVLNVLRNEPLSNRNRLDLSDRPELATQGNGMRDAGIYDRLKTGKAVLV